MAFLKAGLSTSILVAARDFRFQSLTLATCFFYLHKPNEKSMFFHTACSKLFENAKDNPFPSLHFALLIAACNPFIICAGLLNAVNKREKNTIEKDRKIKQNSPLVGESSMLLKVVIYNLHSDNFLKLRQPISDLGGSKKLYI